MRFQPGATVHFVGIGGAGMSAIAKVLLERGHRVTGSDIKATRVTAVLSAMGARITIGHDRTLVDGADAVVVSSAIPDADPELARAREDGTAIVTRGQALASLLEGDRSIVVAGTHGKTTTTSMIVSISHAAGLDPTYLVGGGLNDAGTNARSGSDDLLIAESDESDGSFLLLRPTIAVITNVEMDHFDHWGSLDELVDAFLSFMKGVEPEGTLVVPAGDAVEEAARATGIAVHTFGTGGDVSVSDIVRENEGTRFTVGAGGETATVYLRLWGDHNVANALAAAGAALAAGMSLAAVGEGLSAFRGVERRFDVRGRVGGVTVVDDYAHHPTEIRATLSAARSGPWERVVAVFQPHRYSRTAALHEAFGASFSDADRIVITDVYGAGEEAVPGVTGKLVVDAVCNAAPNRTVAYIPHRSEVVPYLEATARSGDVVLTLGAGDITTIGTELLEKLGGSG